MCPSLSIFGFLFSFYPTDFYKVLILLNELILIKKQEGQRVSSVFSSRFMSLMYCITILIRYTPLVKTRYELENLSVLEV